jgi:hypothetical protein
MEVKMFRTGSFFLRLLFGLILIGALVWGASAIFQAGQAQGYALGLSQGSAANPEITPGVQPPMVPYYGYWPFARPYFGFFPFFGLLLLIPLAFLLFGLLFRPWRYGYGSKGYYHHGHPWGPWGQPGAPVPDQPEAPKEPEKE